jgi:hypothetical protein
MDSQFGKNYTLDGCPQHHWAWLAQGHRMKGILPEGGGENSPRVQPWLSIAPGVSDPQGWCGTQRRRYPSQSAKYREALNKSR